MLLLGVAWLLRSELRPAGDEVLALVACGWAVLCPLAAAGLRGEGLIAPAEPAQPGASAARRIVFFAVLESGIALCAVALMLTPLEWPLLAAALPLAVMLVNLPRVGS